MEIGPKLSVDLLKYYEHMRIGKQDYVVCAIIELSWWFYPCRVGGVLCGFTCHGCSFWCLYQNPLSIHIFFLAINTKKNIISENIGQFRFCINLLPLALIWRSAPCLKHWNRIYFWRCFTHIPSGKQWDHKSPWSPNWLSLALTNVVEVRTKVITMDLKIVGWQRFDTRSATWMVGVTFSTIPSGRLSECRKTHGFYSRKRKHSGCQWHVEAVAKAVGPVFSGSCSTDSMGRKDTANVANIPKTTMFNWHINTSHDFQTFHLCTGQETK